MIIKILRLKKGFQFVFKMKKLNVAIKMVVHQIILNNTSLTYINNTILCMYIIQKKKYKLLLRFYTIYK